MINIRRGAFETNSSSVHSLTFCTDDEFRKFFNGDVWYVKENWGLPDNWKEKNFVTPQEAREILMQIAQKEDWDVDVSELTNDELLEMSENEWFVSFDTLGYCGGEPWYETYYDKYTTPSGETVVAFGYYGHD